MKNYYITSINDKTKTCFDLFCGAGGLSLGFCQAGGRPVAAVDNDSDSIHTYSNMFGGIGVDAQCINIEEWSPNYNGKVDVIIGGPPCQGFSTAGKRFIDDPRNKLYKFFVKTVKDYSPQWIVMENVPGILTFDNGNVLKQILEDFGSIGYTLNYKIINMAEYGVPQARRRTIFVGNKNGVDFVWPTPSRIKYTDGIYNPSVHYRSVATALSDLNYPQGNYFSHRANSKMRGPRNRDVTNSPAFTLRVRGDEFALCSEPAISAFAPGPMPTEALSYCPAKNEYQLAMREQAPFWVHQEYIPPEVTHTPPALKGTRRLTLTEQARLQSFPDWFQFYGKIYSQSRQIGNAVPPLFAKQLFLAIFNQFEK